MITIKNIICPDVALCNSTMYLSWNIDTDQTDLILFRVDFFNGTTWVNCADNTSKNNLLYQLPSIEISNAKFRISASGGATVTGYIKSSIIKIIKGTVVPVASSTITKGKLKEQELSQNLLDKINANKTQPKEEYILVSFKDGVYKGNNSNITSYYKGLSFYIEININSVGASKVNISGLGDRTVLDVFKNQIIKDGLKTEIPYHLCYNGKDFIVLGKGGGGNVKPNQMLIGTSGNNDSGPVEGTIPIKGYQVWIPKKVDQVISGGQYLAEDQIIKGYPDLLPENVAANKQIGDVIGIAMVNNNEYTNNGVVTVPASSSPIKVSFKLVFNPSLIAFFNPITSESGIIDVKNNKTVCVISNNTTKYPFTVTFNILTYEVIISTLIGDSKSTDIKWFAI